MATRRTVVVLRRTVGATRRIATATRRTAIATHRATTAARKTTIATHRATTATRRTATAARRELVKLRSLQADAARASSDAAAQTAAETHENVRLVLGLLQQRSVGQNPGSLYEPCMWDSGSTATVDLF